VQAACQRIRLQFPADKSRLLPERAQRLALIEQAIYVLHEPERRQVYDTLRQQRNARHTQQKDDAQRGMDCFQAGRFDDAARLLRAASHRAPDDETLHIHYCLSLLYGCIHLASPEDWRVTEMIQATEKAMQASNKSPISQALNQLCHAIDHYDKDRFDQGWAIMAQLTQALPNWHLPWIVSAYWCRREHQYGEVLARAERVRRLNPNDHLLANLKPLLRTAWKTAPALLPDAARRAAHLLADGTSAHDLQTIWR
jgi:hypothetical protein